MTSASLRRTLRANGAAIIAVWTVFIALLAASTWYVNRLVVLKEAANEARDYYRLNLAYRSWASRLGGVYAAADKVAANPYLKSRRRDVTTTDGQELTLVNPAYMTRMVFDSIKSSSPNPILNKITSLKPLNPSNAPDAWERLALEELDKGDIADRSEVTSIDGAPYLRFIASFVTEPSCLECHGHQGYRVGDIRGGITVAIPLAGYYALEKATNMRLQGGYLLLWLVGSGGIVVSSRRRYAYENELRAGEQKFRTVCDWTQDWEYWRDQNGAMKYVSPSCLDLTGHPPGDFLDDPDLALRLVHEEDLSEFREHHGRTLGSEHPSADQCEFRIVRKDGAVRWIHHACRPVFSDGLYLGRRVSNRDVTDRKLGERELAIRAELLNCVSDSVLVVDRSGRILDANETAWRSRGFSREELLSMSAGELDGAGQAEQGTRRLARVFENGSAYFESEHRLKDGGSIFVEINSRLIDYRGEPAVLSSIRDITKRKLTEDSLRRSERFNVSLNRISQALLISRSDQEMYGELIATVLDVMDSPVGKVGYLDAAGALVFPSLPRAAGAFDRLLGTGAASEEGEGEECLLREALRTGEARYANRPGQVPNCHVAVERCLAVPLLYQGRSIGLLTVANAARDYDEDDLQMLCAIGAHIAPVLQARLEQQQAAAALRESESKLRVIFDVIQSGIIHVDAMGTVLFANQRMAEMLGMAMGELLGSSYSSHVCPEQCGSADQCMRQLLEGEVDSIHVERHYLRKDGTDFWGYLTGQRFASPDGKQVTLMGTISDLTELKSAEEKRHRSEHQMLHVQKLESLGVLAGGIAHDFNNILLAIMGNASLALHRSTPGSAVEHHLRQIELAAGKAADLARQMLAYSGKGRFVLETLDLSRLVREMTAMLEVSVAKKAELRFHLAESLPCIVADPTQIRQIVMNLAINGSEAIGENSGAISIATGVRNCDRHFLTETWLNDELSEGPYVFLEIADTGCGMDRETVERIFEPFFTTKFTGRGLGMAAILGIVRGHKGAIKVHTEQGKGSCFSVYFPATEGGEEIVNVGSADEAWRGKGTVLVVDDEETVRAVGCAMLSELGFTVLSASDGSEALELYRLRRDEIVLVLMDLNMPRLNGEETFHELRKIDPRVRVVLSSGYSEHEVTRLFLGKGLAGFVQKPYTLDTLRHVLSGVTRRVGLPPSAAV